MYRLWDFGKWRNVIIDDRLPWANRNLPRRLPTILQGERIFGPLA